jgi:hypothetical protein
MRTEQEDKIMAKYKIVCEKTIKHVFYIEACSHEDAAAEAEKMQKNIDSGKNQSSGVVEKAILIMPISD